MLFVGSFEGIDFQRAIARRCPDSLSPQAFLGTTPEEATSNAAMKNADVHPDPKRATDGKASWGSGR
jgi:hypothetical protein